MIDLARQLPLLITRCANMLTYSFFDGKQGDISRNVNISVRCIFLFFRTQFVSWFQRFLLVSWKISTVKRMIFFCNVTEKLSRYKNIYFKTHDFKTLAVLFWLISNFMLFCILWYEKKYHTCIYNRSKLSLKISNISIMPKIFMCLLPALARF